MKVHFRRVMLRKKLDKEPIELMEIVEESAQVPSQELRLRCALNGWKMLNEAKE